MWKHLEGLLWKVDNGYHKVFCFLLPASLGVLVVQHNKQN